MAYVYKKFTANDFATVPFNAHKQYNFTSESATANNITYIAPQYTSESISLYSTSSAAMYNYKDGRRPVEYQQIDHLFYKNFKRDLANKFGDYNYAKQRRVLYEKTNIISVPNGLVGYEIRPKSLFISTSKGLFTEDTDGNLIISGNNLNNYVTDIESNLLNIGPLKGFERFDLNTIDGYEIKNINYEINGFYRDGKLRTNTISTYSTPDFGD